MQGDNQVSGYFDIEKPVFKLVSGPAWLSIDSKTGLLSGVPDASGKAEVSVSVSLSREKRELDAKALVWGLEKVVSKAVDLIGTATQDYVIEVR
jgi:hypothetical protein